jgi:DNA repair protein SbcD/Mre11
LILDLKVPVILIAGNHDSPLRIEFAARLMETHRLYFYGSISERLQTIEMFDKWGSVTFFPLPYSEPSYTSEFFSNPKLTNHEDALRQWISFFRRKRIPGNRAVLVHHAYVAGSEVSESERPLDVGGADVVSADCFDDFDYAALGHLHRPQNLGQNGHIHYPGSLLKYSFSEADQRKGIKLVEIDGAGECQVETIPLIPKRDVCCIEGTIEDLLSGRVKAGNREDYMQVRLLDTGAVFDAMDRLRDVFPNLVALDHESLIPVGGDINRLDHRKRELIGLFNDFYAFGVSKHDISTQNRILESPLNEF